MGEHATHNLHANSVASFESFQLSERDALVLGVFTASTVALTDRQVADRLGFADMNAVRPSITRLTERHILQEYASVKCPKTKKTVRTSGRP